MLMDVFEFAGTGKVLYVCYRMTCCHLWFPLIRLPLFWFQLVGILQDQYCVRSDVATLATQTFLCNFCLCPDNHEMTSDKWQHLLQCRAHGGQYEHTAGCTHDSKSCSVAVKCPCYSYY